MYRLIALYLNVAYIISERTVKLVQPKICCVNEAHLQKKNKMFSRVSSILTVYVHESSVVCLSKIQGRKKKISISVLPISSSFSGFAGKNEYKSVGIDSFSLNFSPHTLFLTFSHSFTFKLRSKMKITSFVGGLW